MVLHRPVEPAGIITTYLKVRSLSMAQTARINKQCSSVWLGAKGPVNFRGPYLLERLGRLLEA